VLSGKAPSEFSTNGLVKESLSIDEDLRQRNWGEGVTYVSLIDKLCSNQGCRRLVGPRVPDDIMTFDSGHLSRNGSIFVVKNILGPTIKAALSRTSQK
jgi:hypothetical protein